MVKIKTKKKMNLPELIQWAWENGEEQRFFHGSKDGSVCFNDDGWVNIERAVEPDEIFTFEVEEEITADTVITNLVEVYEYNEIMESAAHGECSITNALGEEVDNVSRLAFYILNDDMSMALLWKDGEMVE